MKSRHISRRHLLLSTAVVLGASSMATKAMADTCATPDGPDASLRQSLHYVESGPDAAEQCKACSFFSEPDGSCGKCAIFNGAANAGGHCDSWSARA
jgi:hypothetical protein